MALDAAWLYDHDAAEVCHLSASALPPIVGHATTLMSTSALPPIVGHATTLMSTSLPSLVCFPRQRFD
jgi:hypothetical protein